MSFDSGRREVLRLTGALALAGIPLTLFAAGQDDELVDFADLGDFVVEGHAASPRVKYFDLRRLASVRTPDAEFYTFHQTETAQVNPLTWRLRIGGFVHRTREFTIDQILQRPDRRDLAVTLECSGNSGDRAANGMVSSGVWTGVGLASILNECGVRPEAREVAFFGMDLERESATGAEAAHGRSVFVQDATDPAAMLAFELNGKPLSADRGYPLRLILPGWYGMTHIKWLQRIEVLDRRYEGMHMARNYHTVRETPLDWMDGVVETSISRTRLKSVIAKVTRRKGPGNRYAYTIHGAVWGGAAELKAVEVSVDGGQWREVRLGESGGGHAWTLWTIDWANPASGDHSLVSRAIDSSGMIQPTLEQFRSSVRTLRENNAQWPRRITIR